MTALSILGLGAVVALIAARHRCPRAAAFLGAWVAADAARLLLAPLRAGAPLPYAGGARVLWMLCEVVPMALPPAALLAAVSVRAHAAGLLVLAVAFVAVTYPALRGSQLVAAWEIYYAAAYGVAAAVIGARGLRARLLEREDVALLALALTGLASVAVLVIAGSAAWWAVTITYGCGLVGAAAASLGFFEPRE
jgi:hypothetical protein